TKLEKDLKEANKKEAELTKRWESDKEVIYKMGTLKEGIEATRSEMEKARREGDLSLAAELQYGKLPDLESKLDVLSKDASHRLIKEEVGPDDIAQTVSKWTGIPVGRLLEGEREKLVHMEERLGQRVIGQDEALKVVSRAVRRARSGIGDPNRPIGSFIFMGPTGVGKTEMGRALAEFLFDSETAMVRLDMSEYVEKHQVARLIGAPPGYVGYEEGGYLTEAVRRNPYSVVLFDEIEKAHPEVFNTLLQILDDGRLTDGQGRTVDFKNTVIIMTSNIGSQYIVNGDEDTGEKSRKVMEALRSHFRPEFLNRIDDIVIFKALSLEALEKVVRIQVELLASRLAERKLTMKLTPKAVTYLVNVGYDPVYGARPLKRAIQTELMDPLAMKLLNGDILDGQALTVDVAPDGGSLIITATQGSDKALAIVEEDPDGDE
ncbi:MAG: AAA family ATPase, partial [Deltaproteobacteria bacterium]|nr:AAA family ATPase [Deltaproteobacteria bacterium]